LHDSGTEREARSGAERTGEQIADRGLSEPPEGKAGGHSDERDHQRV
jgi:hypothetical protein